MANLKQLAKKGDLLTGGHRACVGCGATIIARQVLAATETPVVCSISTGCLEVVSTLYPFNAWQGPFIHNAFENSAATISGIEACYRALKRRGKIDREIKFIGWGGDGGTYDIGIQALSGAVEREHDFLFICYDNQAYMNTGIQRSSATPLGAHTTTSPAGSVIPGKIQNRKDLTEIMIAHDIPYAAQASPGHWNDLATKVRKALNTPGATFINILSPCQLGWRHEPSETIEIARIAVDTCFWPLYEVENGNYKITKKPKKKLPISAFLENQGRFRHLMKPENKKVVEELQAFVDRKWELLLERAT
ncbi:pyruvate ferredoxin oxidoreductase [candidate division TA06 bacterium]|uniref:Pyruvate ferredoxin oxidoreductase n=1 Tax=candidate division TA06 bacterium TaxID=2250710 RepID=A0A523XXX7_UNCT6|nr:MAG: pyruvate ferredoxin oxidoreductase [candidate division TA06 bacterium]